MLITLLAGCGQPTPAPTQRQPDQSAAPATPSVGASSTGDEPDDSPSATPSAKPPTRKVLLDEDFSGDTLDRTNWNTCHWWDDDGCTITSNNELQWYRPEGVRVADGALQLVAERGDQRASDGETYPFRSGMVTTGPTKQDGDPKVAFTYGIVEARLRVPSGQGLWSAMWLLPASTESRPEIDVMEILGNDPTEAILHFHPQNRKAKSPSKTVTPRGVAFSKGWHDFRIDWSPNRLDYVIDGKRVWRVSGAQVPDEPMYLIFNLAVGGVYPGDPGASTNFPATFAIDRVKITAGA
ncbi:MAG TPA: family 16 glycosylhydrolase [Microlunatus sp.]